MRRLRAAACAGLALLSPAARASAEPEIRFAAGVRTAAIPFDADFGLVFLHANVDGGAPLTFLLDTGFDPSALDAERARSLGLAAEDTRSVAAPGGSVTVGDLRPVTLSVPGLEVRGVSLQAIPLAALAPVIGRRLDGILGHDVLERLVVVIDYARRQVEFHDPASFSAAGHGDALPVTIVEREPFVEAAILEKGRGEIAGRFKLDTGSVDVAGLNKNFLDAVQLPGRGRRAIQAPGAALGGETKGILFRVNGIRLGRFVLHDPVIGATLESGGFENRADAGTLGAGLLAHFAVVLDYPHERILLRPNAGAGRPASEDRCGLLLVAEGDSTVRVRWVAEGSPAAQVGIGPGDVLNAVDGRPASAWGLAGLWSLLRGEPGTTHRLRIVRGGEQREVLVRLKSYM